MMLGQIESRLVELEVVVAAICKTCRWLFEDRDTLTLLHMCDHPGRIMKKLNYVTGFFTIQRNSCYEYNQKGECKLWEEKVK